MKLFGNDHFLFGKVFRSRFSLASLAVFVTAIAFLLGWYTSRRDSYVKEKQITGILEREFVASCSTRLQNKPNWNPLAILRGRPLFEPIVSVDLVVYGNEEVDLANQLSALKALEHVGISSGGSNAKLKLDLKRLSKCKIKSLAFEGFDLDNQQLEDLVCLESLAFLALNNSKLNNLDVHRICNLDLESLDLSFNPLLTDDCLESISSIQKLNSLRMEGCSIGNNAFRASFSFATLETLDLSGTEVGDETVARICNRCPRLHTMFLIRTAVSNKSKSFFERHLKLQTAVLPGQGQTSIIWARGGTDDQEQAHDEAHVDIHLNFNFGSVQQSLEGKSTGFLRKASEQSLGGQT